MDADRKGPRFLFRRRIMTHGMTTYTTTKCPNTKPMLTGTGVVEVLPTLKTFESCLTCLASADLLHDPNTLEIRFKQPREGLRLPVCQFQTVFGLIPGISAKRFLVWRDLMHSATIC